MDITTTEAAAAIKCHPITARKLCAKHGIGRLVNDRIRLLSHRDVATLARKLQKKGWPKVIARKAL